METSGNRSLIALFKHIFILCLLSFLNKGEASNNKVSAFYIFGDSTVDAGNNNYITTAFKSNFPPYGRDLPNQVSTGRFTNGKLATDYIASYLGLKREFLPPYLDPTLSIDELMTGVSFASAGSGLDPLTPRISRVIPLQIQLEYYKESKKKIEGVLGKQRAEDHIKKAVFLVSVGTNDFVVNYFALPMRRNSFNLSTYQQFLIQQVKDFIQDLRAEGAGKIAVVGLPPMGCLPIMISLTSRNFFGQRVCIDKYSGVARDYNKMLQQELHSIQINSSNHGTKLYYVDIYSPLSDMIQGNQRSEFDTVDTGCCGTGFVEAAFLCNRISKVCSDPSKYVFWDSMHPTEKAYHSIFMASRSTVDLIVNDS